MRESMIEMRMSGGLAHRLGAIVPGSLDEHRKLRASGDYMMVRDPRILQPMFWRIVPGADLSRPSS